MAWFGFWLGLGIAAAGFFLGYGIGEGLERIARAIAGKDWL